MPPNFVFDPIQIVRSLPATTIGNGLIVTIRVALVVPHSPKDDAVIVAVPLNDEAQSISPEEELIMGEELERFAENTLSYLQREAHLLVDDPHIPDVDLDFRGRHVLVVVREGEVGVVAREVVLFAEVAVYISFGES